MAPGAAAQIKRFHLQHDDSLDNDEDEDDVENTAWMKTQFSPSKAAATQ